MREVIVVRDWGDEVNRRAVAGGADGSAQFASAGLCGGLEAEHPPQGDVENGRLTVVRYMYF